MQFYIKVKTPDVVEASLGHAYVDLNGETVHGSNKEYVMLFDSIDAVCDYINENHPDAQYTPAVYGEQQSQSGMYVVLDKHSRLLQDDDFSYAAETALYFETEQHAVDFLGGNTRGLCLLWVDFTKKPFIVVDSETGDIYGDNHRTVFDAMNYICQQSNPPGLHVEITNRTSPIEFSPKPTAGTKKASRYYIRVAGITDPEAILLKEGWLTGVHQYTEQTKLEPTPVSEPKLAPRSNYSAYDVVPVVVTEFDPVVACGFASTNDALSFLESMSVKESLAVVEVIETEYSHSKHQSPSAHYIMIDGKYLRDVGISGGKLKPVLCNEPRYAASFKESDAEHVLTSLGLGLLYIREGSIFKVNQ